METVSCQRNNPTATAPPIHNSVGHSAKNGAAGDGRPNPSTSSEPPGNPPIESISSKVVRSNHITAAQMAFMTRSTTEAENEFRAASTPTISAPPGNRPAPLPDCRARPATPARQPDPG